ncbi:MAG: DNRLRE domain-containing protein, partial [Kiritimatiellae bacterium]|nr:DNRLRE domain-containing protein [Kiritimatiellia bacterium]
IAGVLAFSATLCARADTITFQQGAANALTDAYTGVSDNLLAAYSEAANASLNYGTYNRGVIGNPAWGGTGYADGCACRTILRFDLSLLGDKYESVTVNSVTLTLTKLAVFGAGPVQVYAVLPVNEAWQVGTKNGATETGSSCWRARGYNAADWAGHALGTNGCGASGIDYAVEPLATNAWSTSMGSTLALSFDQVPASNLTALINAWMDNPMNAGILIRTTPDKEALAGTPYFMWHSCEATDTNQRPLLTIDYTPGPVEKTLVFQQGLSNQVTASYAGMEDNLLAAYADGSQATFNYGSYASGDVGNPGWNGDCTTRTIMRFDLSDLQAIKYDQINSVTLRLTKNLVVGSGTIWVHSLLPAAGDWQEGTSAVGATQTGMSCWAAKAYNSAYWPGHAVGTNGCGVAGMDYAAQPLASKAWNATGSTLDLNFDGLTPAELTALIGYWRDDPDNAGILLRASPEDEVMPAQEYRWHSKENTTVGNRPMLIIRYRPLPRGTVILLR